MALLLRDGSIFLHIPKTGGNWVTQVLYREKLVRCEFGAYKHVDLAHLFTSLGPTPWKQFKHWSRNLPARVRINLNWRRHGKPYMFCFVRHPLSWYESWFKYMHQESMQWRRYGDERRLADWHPNALLNGTGSEDFNSFMRNVLARRPGYVTELFGNYTQPGMIDFVGKQENLRDDLISVLASRGLDFNPDRIRDHVDVGISTPRPGLEIVWDRQLRDEVLKLEYAAIKRYGYQPSHTQDSPG